MKQKIDLYLVPYLKLKLGNDPFNDKCVGSLDHKETFIFCLMVATLNLFNLTEKVLLKLITYSYVFDKQSKELFA